MLKFVPLSCFATFGHSDLLSSTYRSSNATQCRPAHDDKTNTKYNVHIIARKRRTRRKRQNFVRHNAKHAPRCSSPTRPDAGHDLVTLDAAAGPQYCYLSRAMPVNSRIIRAASGWLRLKRPPFATTRMISKAARRNRWNVQNFEGGSESSSSGTLSFYFWLFLHTYYWMRVGDSRDFVFTATLRGGS
ncbi:hypothetical protein HDV62DRAFT_251904 [Trichoderma sp. SZMC 28011]